MACQYYIEKDQEMGGEKSESGFKMELAKHSFVANSVFFSKWSPRPSSATDGEENIEEFCKILFAAEQKDFLSLGQCFFYIYVFSIIVKFTEVV